MQKTISIRGIGQVFINTNSKYVNLVLYFNADGTPGDIEIKQVYCSKRYQDDADNNSSTNFLNEEYPGLYVLEQFNDNFCEI